MKVFQLVVAPEKFRHYIFVPLFCVIKTTSAQMSLQCLKNNVWWQRLDFLIYFEFSQLTDITSMYVKAKW